jgi:hypothetical protein
MGHGFLRRRKLAQFQQAVNAMKKQTDEILNDPNSAVNKMVAPLLQQLQQAKYTQNRLSALVAAIIEQTPENQIVLKRGAIEKFQGHRIIIHNQTPETDDGTDPEVEIIFTSRAELLPEDQRDPQPALTADIPQPTESPVIPPQNADSGQPQVEENQ